MVKRHRLIRHVLLDQIWHLNMHLKAEDELIPLAQSPPDEVLMLESHFFTFSIGHVVFLYNKAMVSSLENTLLLVHDAPLDRLLLLHLLVREWLDRVHLRYVIIESQ